MAKARSPLRIRKEKFGDYRFKIYYSPNMYCPSCGTEYALGLPYCNRCGANLSSALSEPTEGVSINITKAVAAIGTTMAVLTLGGFMMLIFGAVRLAERITGGTDPIIALMVLGMATILVSDILLARQLSRLIEAGLTTNKARTGKRSVQPTVATHELNRPTTTPLPPGLSVTENTTRFLEHQYRGPSEAETPEPKTFQK